jgi:hypothetical protein
VKRIELNPWIPESLAESVSEMIRGIEGCGSIRVRQSTLIKNQQWQEAGDRVVGREPAGPDTTPPVKERPKVSGSNEQKGQESGPKEASRKLTTPVNAKGSKKSMSGGEELSIEFIASAMYQLLHVSLAHRDHHGVISVGLLQRHVFLYLFNTFLIRRRHIRHRPHVLVVL